MSHLFNIKNDNLKIGFTGTQQGMTCRQYESFDKLMKMISCLVEEYHHGDCKGSDEEFHKWIYCFDYRPIKIIIHPPNIRAKRAFCRSIDLRDYLSFVGKLEVRYPKPYLERNQDIVTETNILIATPKEYQEVLRSGTWSTVRAARRQLKPIYIIYPDGEIIKDGN